MLYGYKVDKIRMHFIYITETRFQMSRHQRQFNPLSKACGCPVIYYLSFSFNIVELSWFISKNRVSFYKLLLKCQPRNISNFYFLTDKLFNSLSKDNFFMI